MSDTVQSIDRAFRILELLSENPDGLGLLEISHRTGLTKSTVHRLLMTLQENGMTKQLEPTGKYSLTMKLFVLGSRVVEKREVLQVARPYLEKLRDISGEAVHLVIREGDELVYVDKVESENTIRMYSTIGRKGVLYATSVGKALLALSPQEEVASYWNRTEVIAQTPQTIVDFPAFLRELERIRQEGYALDREENELGVKCVGAAIRDYTGKAVAAISVSGPAQRMTPKVLETIGGEVQKITREISIEMGYSGHSR